MNRCCYRWLLAPALVAAISASVQSADDGRRAVDVKRFGISVRVPQAWRLISWARDNEAFVLRIPQDSSASKGFVRCELSPAPAALADLLKTEQPVQPVPERPMKTRLVESRIEPVEAAQLGERLAAQVRERLLAVWELESDLGQRAFEVRCRMVAHGELYSFTMFTDEAHYEAYRLDFEDMLASARFTAPDTGLEPLAGGLWLQRDFRFALRLPEGWKPAFGPSDKALLFATGPKQAGMTDSLVVEATPAHALDLDKLKETLPAELTRRDDRARVTCSIVPQGATFALETRVSTWRGEVPVTSIERHFRTAKRNYIIRFTCETGRLDQLLPEFEKTFASFVEVLESRGRGDA